MKKTLLLGTALGLSVVASAQGSFTAKILPDLYAMKMSQNGKIIASYITEETYLYNVETEKITTLAGFQAGNGNCFSADGSLLVGSDMNDQPVLVKGGEMIYPSNLGNYSFCLFNGITSNGSRIVGLVNSQKQGPMYEPAVFDVNADGKVSDPVILPYPEKDIFGTVPQYVTGTWISADGHKILGMVIADNGMFMYPIIFTQGADNKWSYSIPVEDLLNPNHLELPENPGDFEMEAPDAKNYMTEEEAAAYQAAMDEWMSSGFDPSKYPDEADYMTAEELAKYKAYEEEYNQKATEYNNKLMAFQEVLYQIIGESVNFLQNAYSLNEDGSMAAVSAIEAIEDNTDPEFPTTIEYNPMYLIDMANNTARKIDTKLQTPLPNQILDGGIVVASTPLPGPMSMSQLPPMTYVWCPGYDDWMPLNEFVGKSDAPVSAWMVKNLTHNIPVGVDENWEIINADVLMSGHAMVSDDFSVIAGGLESYLYYPDGDGPEYETYLITGVNVHNGVEDAVAEAEGTLTALAGGILSVKGSVSDVTVYDLAGAAVYNAASLSGNTATGLADGFYVVRYTNAQGQKVSQKVKF